MQIKFNAQPWTIRGPMTFSTVPFSIMTLSILIYSTVTFSIMTLRIMTLSILIYWIVPFSIMTLRMRTLGILTLSITKLRHNDTQHNET
jgi:hypothetical protein